MAREKNSRNSLPRSLAKHVAGIRKWVYDNRGQIPVHSEFKGSPEKYRKIRKLYADEERNIDQIEKALDELEKAFQNTQQKIDIKAILHRVDLSLVDIHYIRNSMLLLKNRK